MDLNYDKVDQTVLPISNTRVVADEYNQIAGSLMSIISASGLTPDSADNTQLLNALKAIGSGWSLPDTSNIETLTVGASGAHYTATADGYFYATGTGIAATSTWLELQVVSSNSSTTGLYGVGAYSDTTNVMKLLLPVTKGAIMYYAHKSGVTERNLYFIKAKGAQ